MDENSKKKDSGEVSISAPAANANVSYEELLKVKKIFEEMQDIAHFGTWEWDINSGVCLLSHGVCGIFGIDRSCNNIDYDSFSRFRRPGYRDAVEKALCAAIAAKRPYNIDYSIVRTDGEIRHVFEYGSFTYDNNGNAVRALGSIKDITENVRMQEKLYENEHLYRTLFENTEDAFVIAELIYDANGRVCDFKLVQFNDMFEKQTGVKQEDAAERLAKETNPDLEHQWIEMCEYVMKSGKSVHFQQYNKGTSRWYDVFCFPYKQGRISAIFRDITQYKATEEALREANAANRLILDSINDGYGMFDRDGRVLKIGRKFADKLGKTPEECVGLKLDDYLPEEKYAQLNKQRNGLTQKVFETGKLVEFQDTRDGRWYNHRCYPVFKDGKVNAVSIISTDITDSRKAEEEAQKIMQLKFETDILRKKEQEYLELLDGTFEGTRIIDFEAKRVEFSPKWAARLGLAGYTPEELFKNANKFIHKDDLENVLCYRELGARNKAGHYNQEYRILTGDSEYIWILDRGKVVYNEDGTVSKVYASSIDITERKSAQEKINRQNTILQAINRIYERYVFCETLEQLGTACLEAINEATGSGISFITELGEDGLIYEVAISPVGWGDSIAAKTGKQEKPRRFPVRGIYGHILKSGKTLLTNDPGSHPESTGIPDGHPEICAFLGVPFLRNGKAVGMVAAANKEGGYTENEQEILEAVTPTIFEVLLRKRAEISLRESEERYRGVVQNTSAVILRIDSKGVILFANRRALEFFGFEESELIGKHVLGTIVPEREISGRDLMAMVTQLSSNPERFNIHANENIRKSGERVWMEWNNTVIYDSEGRVKESLCVGIDATERKRAEQALRESEERYRGVVENTSAVILRMSPQGIIHFANRRALEFFGFNEEELIGKHVIGTIVPEQDADGCDLAAMIEEIFARPNCYQANANENIRKNGERVWMEWNNSLVYDSEGRVKEFLSVGIDATERKMAEKALRESEEHSRALVRQLEEADKNKNAFLSALSHEVRNPLATISAGLQLMDISDDASKIKSAKGIISRQMAQLCSLVDELLDLTRITNNKIVLKKQRLELNELVSLIAKDHMPIASKRGLRLEVQFSSSDVYLDADPVRIKQIAGNLLHNAFKFTKAGGEVVLSVSEQNGKASLCVSDTGIGIAPEYLPGVFEPFTQIDRNIDRQGGGLGLGLSIVKGIAQLHGGDAEAYSEGEGKGACFCIRFPSVKEKTERKTERTVQNNADKLKVLFIEDNIDYSDMICDLLSHMGHVAAAAYDGIEGIVKAKAFMPDVIICDIGLPGMNGYETARTLREDNNMKDVFLIALSGYTSPKFAEAAEEAGFDLHIAKPVDIDTLKHILSTARGKHNQ